MKRQRARSSGRIERRATDAKVAGSSPAGPSKLTKAELWRLGEQLYSYGWQTKLAEAIGISSRQMRRYASGGVPIPIHVAMAIKYLAGEYDI